jgi:regulator of protease activity HflC (stomatin/prohibitin superfamily)
MTVLSLGVLVILILIIMGSALRILNEYERGVIFRLGRVRTVGGKPEAKGPGLIFLIPIVDKLVKVSLRVVTMDVPPQDVITRDNISLKVNAVIYFRVMDPIKAIIEIENYLYGTSQLSQTTLRSVCGQVELDDILYQRDKINMQIQDILDKHTEPWGVKVTAVEVKAIDLPEEMRRAMATQAEAERERRSKVIRAEGEYQAAERLKDAAVIIADHPMALTLRYLQTLTEVAKDKNSTTIFPIPIDLIKPFLKLAERAEMSSERAEMSAQQAEKKSTS